MANRFPPLFSTPMMSAPQAAPIALPRAPERLAPPMTQAAMACSSKPVPAVGTPAPRRDVSSTPPTAASTPEITYTAVVTMATGTPASRAASGLDPTAYTYRPNTVRFRTNHAIAVMIAKMISRLGIPSTVPLATVWKPSGRPWIVLASVITRTMPRTPPTTIPIRMAGMIGTPETSSWAVTAPASPRMDPTDRSMPPVRMTTSWPIARMPKMATWRARLARLLPVRNSGLARVRAPTATSRTISPPLSRPAMSPRVLTRTLGRGAGISAAAVASAAARVVDVPPPSVASPPGLFAASSSRTLVMTVVSMGSRHRSLGIGHLLNVLVDDWVEVGIVDHPRDSVQVVPLGFADGDHAATGQLQDGLFGGAGREFAGDCFVA